MSGVGPRSSPLGAAEFLNVTGGPAETRLTVLDAMAIAALPVAARILSRTAEYDVIARDAYVLASAMLRERARVSTTVHVVTIPAPKEENHGDET
jgi:hypothetical protein